MHQENYSVYGIRKVWAQLGREGGVDGRPVARCTVARLMKAAGLRGVSRVKTPRTTIRAADPDPDLDPDLVERAFTAAAPNRLWVADITYVKTHSGWVYASFVLDVFSRRIVGWQLSTNLYTDLALDALNMGIWTRRHVGDDLSQLIHHSDCGVQYVAIRYTERLSEVDAVASVGSVGDSYDNAMAEAFNSLFKANSSATKDRGPASTISNSPWPSTSTGTTTAGCTANSGRSHPSSTRPYTQTRPSPGNPPKRENPAPTKPGT